MNIQNYNVYLLRCKDNTLYCGITTNLEKRVAKHNTGQGARYTRSRIPVELVWYKECDARTARRAELKIKSLSRAMKEKLVAGEIAFESVYS